MFPSAEHPKALQAFQILDRLGSGGAGQVYLARSKAGRLVAIKVLSDAKVRDAAFSHALVREASLCVRLTHPSIVQVRAFIEEEGFAAIVFDYVDGIALVRLMKFCAALGVRLPDRVAWHVVESVLAGLAFAHAQMDEAHAAAPIVHRDVSPSNVLVAWKGDVKLADFGIAKMLGVSPATKFGLVKGTLGCMAPEQARGEPVDERADVYAAGLLAWRLATGRNPFAASRKEEIELLRAMRNPRLKPLAALRPKLPEPILEAVGAALAPDPQDRTITADQFARVVRESLDIEAGRRELGELLERWRAALERRSPRAAVVPARMVPESAEGAAQEGNEGGWASSPELTQGSTESSGHNGHQTMRYEDVAVFDDDDVPADGPTVQMQALPGDEKLWAALALQAAPMTMPRVSMSDSEHMRASEDAARISKDTTIAPLAPVKMTLSEPDLSKSFQSSPSTDQASDFTDVGGLTWPARRRLPLAVVILAMAAALVMVLVWWASSARSE